MSIDRPAQLTFARLFNEVKMAQSALRDYARPFARQRLGNQYVDNANGYLGWDVVGVWDGGSLVGLDFKAITADDRGPATFRNFREMFIDPNGPLTDDQRRALFGAFGEVFGHTDQAQRLAFTRMVLGKHADAVVSWSKNKTGRLTYGEASKVLDALDVLNV